MKADLLSKNVTINGRRTSLRLERINWDALRDICECEGLTVHELCTLIDNRRQTASRTSAVRAFIISYWHSVARAAGAVPRKAGSARLNRIAAGE